MRTWAVVIATCIFGGHSATADLIFNISTTGNAQADAGFQAAGDFWSSVFTDDITVNVNAGFANLGGSILGQASSSQAAITGDATSVDDSTFTANLPTCPLGTHFPFTSTRQMRRPVLVLKLHTSTTTEERTIRRSG